MLFNALKSKFLPLSSALLSRRRILPCEPAEYAQSFPVLGAVPAVREKAVQVRSTIGRTDLWSLRNRSRWNFGSVKFSTLSGFLLEFRIPEHRSRIRRARIRSAFSSSFFKLINHNNSWIFEKMNNLIKKCCQISDYFFKKIIFFIKMILKNNFLNHVCKKIIFFFILKKFKNYDRALLKSVFIFQSIPSGSGRGLIGGEGF